MLNNKVTSSIWFSAHGGSLAALLEYYQQLFGTNFTATPIISLGDNTPSGNTEMCSIQLFEQNYSLMCTEKEHNSLNDSFSIILSCENQEEIDKYWNYFTKNGQESQCGWCIDKYGLRWQIIPHNLGELISKTNGWQVMMQQKKIIIAEY